MKKLKPIKPNPNPCLHCPNPRQVLLMNRVIAVGFGDAHLERDGKILWAETSKTTKYLTVRRAENMARKDPNADWQIILFGPLHGEKYQRQGKNNWVCVEQNQGFA